MTPDAKGFIQKQPLLLLSSILRRSPGIIRSVSDENLSVWLRAERSLIFLSPGGCGDTEQPADRGQLIPASAL